MSGKRVLIVDDEAPMRFLLSKQLARAGYETDTAADGVAALAALTGEPFDAVVLDVIMPGMDGFELCRRLKADKQTAGLPVLFLSASSSGEFRRRAFSVGAADFLAKPYQTEELPAYLQATLRRVVNSTPTDGRVISVIGASRIAGAASLATQLAEVAALQGPAPVMLIDLELPAGSIGARLQLSGGPNMRVLLQNTGEPITTEAIARVAQRYHGALEVIPAPFSPSVINYGEPQPQRLEDLLDNLLARGYYVVMHLGNGVDSLTRAALKRSETIWLAATSDDQDERETILGAMAAANIPHDRIRPASEALAGVGQQPRTATSHTGDRSDHRVPAAGKLMPVV